MVVWDMANLAFTKISSGKPSQTTGKAAVEFVLKAVEFALSGKIHGLTTAPLSKEGMHLGGYCYPGHTELLAELTQTPDHAMMMVGGGLRVVLVTTHLPLKEVSSALSRERVLRIIRLTHRFLPSFGVARPHIAVTALNPHAGEGGLFGREEIEHIIPAVRQAQEMGLQISGPYPADTLFQPRKTKEFHAIVAMYHDQGLIPVKTAAFGRAVNATIGLPIIRTSVDHGTAYDIVGKGMASPASLLAAIRLAATLKKPTRQKDKPC
jgi:4-hydroxythreonine-4-phosphate dehydrogenase